VLRQQPAGLSRPCCASSPQASPGRAAPAARKPLPAVLRQQPFPGQAFPIYAILSLGQPQVICGLNSHNIFLRKMKNDQQIFDVVDEQMLPMEAIGSSPMAMVINF